MNRYVYIIVLWVCTVKMCAQTFRAIVVDNKKHPIELVSVVLLDSDDSPVCFTRTDDKGRFSILMDADKSGRKLSFSFVGYETKIISLDEFKNDASIVMNEADFVLNEVKVTSKRIEQKSDTLTYSVAGFKQAQDRSIADVIAKMPGLEVKKDGSIEYQGKKINKFYIEGMDLLGSKYSQASENLSADKVKSVQVLENHQPVKMLRNMQFSDRAALNIVLNDDAKNVWTGIVELGSGTSLQDDMAWNRESRLVAMLFGRHLQSISMYKTNNVGKDISGEVSDLVDSDQNWYEAYSPLDGIGLKNVQVDDERVVHNDSHLAATNWLYKPNVDTDWRMQISGLLDKGVENSSATTIYSDILDGISISEQTDVEKRNNTLQGELLYKMNGSNVYVNNTLRGMLDYVHDKANTMLNGTNVRQDVEVKKRYVCDNFNMMRKYGNERNWNLKSVASYNYVPGMLLQHDGVVQNVDVTTYNFDAETSLSHKVGSMHIYYRGGFDSYVHELQSRTSLSTIENRATYKEFRPYLTPSVSYINASVKLNAAVRFSFLNQYLYETHKGQMVAEPSLLFGYVPWPCLEITSRYMFSRNSIGLSDMMDAPIYTSYIYRCIGTGKLEDTKLHSGRLSLTYKDIMHGLFVNLNVSNNIVNGNVIYQSTLDNGIYTRHATDKRGTTTSYVLSGRISKSIGWAKTYMTLSGSQSWTNSEMFVVNDLCDCQLQSTSVGFSVSMRPLRFLSLEEKTNMYANKQINSMIKSLSSKREYWFTHELSTYLLFDKWQIKWNNEYCHTTMEDAPNNFFSDLSVSYRTKEEEWSLELNNMFGNTTYSHHLISSNYQAYSTIILRQREVMLKYSWSF